MAVTIKSNVAPVKIYRFGKTTEGNASMKEVLGGKGANLAEMSSIGVPVPAGFTIPCSASVQYKDFKKKPSQLAAFLSSLWKQVKDGIAYLEDSNEYLPLVSVRSGARVSMPGMMDTILNVGITSANVEVWASRLGEKAAYDSYRRLIQMYSSVALEVPMDKFEEILTTTREETGAKSDADLSADSLRRVVTRYLKMLAELGVEFPDSFEDQLKGAVLAVFRSWDNQRAIEYRKINDIPDDWGTAVNVQSMVFGNLNDQSATGVLFTRDPASGENQIVGEFLINAQGEDVVAGIRTPLPLAQMEPWNSELLSELVDCVSMLEAHYKDMQDVEFTVQDSKLYLLQTRSGKRSAQAAFKIAYDLVMEEVITSEEAVGRVTQKQLLAVMQDTIDPKFNIKPSFIGIAAGGGLATGVAVFTAQDAVNCTQPCILVRKETDPDDIAGMNAALGILTSTGGMTSHAAVVARGMNKSCVVGATDMTVEDGFAHAPGSKTINQFTKLTIDGATGSVWIDTEVPVIPGGSSKEVKSIVGWAMEKAGGVSERLEISHKMTAKEVMESVGSSVCSSVYIDTALLEGNDRLDITPVQTGMKALGIALGELQAQEIIVDLATMEEHLDNYDAILDQMFGVGKDIDKVILVSKANVMANWSQSVRSRVMVKLPDECDPQISAILSKAGVKVMGFVSTVADLLNAGGPVQVSDSVVSKVFGGVEAYKAICQFVEQSTGKKLSGSIGKPVYWYDFLNKEGA